MILTEPPDKIMKQREFPQKAIDSLPEGYKMFWGSKEATDHSLPMNEVTMYWRCDEWSKAGYAGSLSDVVYARPSGPKPTESIFPESDEERQDYPIGTFVTEFFPHALAELSKFSIKNQQKHNPEAPLGWAKDKSIWSINRIFRHCMDGWLAHLRGDKERAKEEFLSLAWRGIEGLERFLTNMEPFKK